MNEERKCPERTRENRKSKLVKVFVERILKLILFWGPSVALVSGVK